MEETVEYYLKNMFSIIVDTCVYTIKFIMLIVTFKLEWTFWNIQEMFDKYYIKHFVSLCSLIVRKM